MRSTCSLVREANRIIVVDPGMVASQRDILAPLEVLGVAPGDVTDVVLSHHHPDHTMNVALFRQAAVHDFWAVYRGDQWEDSEAEGRRLSPSVGLIQVPGHTREDVATVIGTPEGILVCTHLWWTETEPVEDPYSTDPDTLHASRARVLELADIIVPGHGAPFRPGPGTPR